MCLNVSPLQLRVEDGRNHYLYVFIIIHVLNATDWHTPLAWWFLARKCRSISRETSWKAYVSCLHIDDVHPNSLHWPPECIYAWKHHSWNHISAVLLFDFIPIVAHYIIVYTYYTQTIDPMHNACLLNERLGVTAGTRRGGDRGAYAMVEMNDRDQGMTTARFQHVSTMGAPLTARQRRAVQQAPYNRRLTSDHGASGSNSRPTDGPGLQTKRSFVSRGISRSHRPPPLVPSPSPLGLNFTPGAPTYNRGPSKVYAAFAAPVASSEYDKFVWIAYFVVSCS